MKRQSERPISPFGLECFSTVGEPFFDHFHFATPYVADSCLPTRKECPPRIRLGVGPLDQQTFCFFMGPSLFRS